MSAFLGQNSQPLEHGETQLYLRLELVQGGLVVAPRPVCSADPRVIEVMPEIVVWNVEMSIEFLPFSSLQLVSLDITRCAHLHFYHLPRHWISLRD